MRRAEQLVSARELKEAETALREILDESPGDRKALDLLGYVLYFLGRYREAEAVCRQTLGLHPDHPYALKGLGLCVAKRGALDEAVRHLERAIELAPRYFDPYWDLAVTLVDAGRSAEALSVVQRGRTAFPEKAEEWDKMDRHARNQGAQALRTGQKSD